MFLPHGIYVHFKVLGTIYLGHFFHNFFLLRTHCVEWSDKESCQRSRMTKFFTLLIKKLNMKLSWHYVMVDIYSCWHLQLLTITAVDIYSCWHLQLLTFTAVDIYSCWHLPPTPSRVSDVYTILWLNWLCWLKHVSGNWEHM